MAHMVLFIRLISERQSTYSDSGPYSSVIVPTIQIHIYKAEEKFGVDFKVAR